MTQTTITMTTTAHGIGVFLQYPNHLNSHPLPGVENGWTGPLDPGVYAIVGSGSGNVPGTVVSFKIATSQNSKTRSQKVRQDGTARIYITFEIDAAGNVL